MGGRAVEGTGLENRQGGDSFVGSNPTPSATFFFLHLQINKSGINTALFVYTLISWLHRWKGDHVPDAGSAREEHHQAINPNPKTARRGHGIL